MTPFVRTLVQGAIGLLLVLAYWMFESLQTPAMLLPSPRAAFAQAATMLTSGEFLTHAGATLTVLLRGFVPAAVFVILLGIAAARAPLARWWAEAIATAPAAAPLIVFAMPLVLWQGIGSSSKVSLVILVCGFPMLQTFLSALKPDRDTGAPATGRPAPAGNRLPVAILASLRIGLMLAVGAALVGEMLAAREGLGYLLSNYSALFDSASLAATLVIIVVPMALIGTILKAVEEQMAGL